MNADFLLKLYEKGLFPMARSGDDPGFDIFEPVERSILPIEHVHIARSLRKKILKKEFEIRVNTAFDHVIAACAETTPTRDDTWINQPIKQMFVELHRKGHAHSVEAFRNGKLAGGLYGLQVGGAFCGESMFSRSTDASKVALIHLKARMRDTGFTLLDAQFENPHLDQFGQTIVSQADYLFLLADAKKLSPDFMKINGSENELIHAYLQKQEF